MSSIVDVANRANVSISTVSRVMRGTAHPVNELTRKRVLDAVKELGYVPSALAQALVSRDTHIIGVIVGDATDPYFANIVRGVEDRARSLGYLVIICNSDRLPEIELQYLRTLNGYRADGVIFAGGGLTDPEYIGQVRVELERLALRGAAIVTLGQHEFPAASVTVDNRQIVATSAQHLLELGHRRIAYITGPENLTTSRLRLEGFEMAMADARIPISQQQIIPGKYDYESGIRAAQYLVESTEQVTAVLASNDLMGVGCIVGLKRAGVRVPEDMSVIGIDDIAPALYVDPPLTTVAIPMHQLGVASMEKVIELLSDESDVPETTIIPHRLVVRNSTGPVPDR